MENEITTPTETGLTKVINNLFVTKTDKKFIKSRPGAGGQVIKYVEIGYVINQLNKSFGPFWEFMVVDKQIGNKQVWVQGRLTVKDPVTGFSITKETFGGADIKISKSTKEIIDIANDLKAAVSDCTKKCASMFGIASDVFFKEQDQYDQLPSQVNVEEGQAESVRKIIIAKLYAVATKRGFDDEALHITVEKMYNVKSITELTPNQITDLTEKMLLTFVEVPKGEKPKRIKQGKDKETSEDDTVQSNEVVSETTKKLCSNEKCIKGAMGGNEEIEEDEDYCSDECREEHKRIKFEQFVNGERKVGQE